MRTQQTHHPLNHLSQWVYDRYVEFIALKIEPTTSRPKRRVRWKPPTAGTLKINFDRAIFAEEKCSDLGVIVHDREGLVIASMAARVPQQLQPIEIEALAANKALEFVRDGYIRGCTGG